MNRDANEPSRERSMLPTTSKIAALRILDRIRANGSMNNESSLLSAIEEALLANGIITSVEYF